jgi:O-antigen ligase
MSIPQIRNRILEGRRDFNIAGGRKIMWQIGKELTQQYPMGIGFGNSRELRSFSYEIPPQHRHFHNNFLNIAVETGWPGILIFITWIGIILRNIGSLNGLPLALLSNQMAGLVEYNFGDSEILMILFICLGIYLGERASSP